MFIGPGSSLTAENADGPGPGPKTERNQNPAEETTQAHPSEPLCDTYFLLAHVKPPSPGTPGSPPHTPNDGALHQSSLRGPTGRRRADSAPGAIISTVALDGSLRSPPAGPRNYLPVIAPPAPPPPAACSVLPPVAYCYWPLAVWPPPPPLPPGPGRQRQRQASRSPSQEGLSSLPCPVSGQRACGPCFLLRCALMSWIHGFASGAPANAGHCFCLDLARRASQPQQRTHGPRPTGSRAAKAHGAAAVHVHACHFQCDCATTD